MPETKGIQQTTGAQEPVEIDFFSTLMDSGMSDIEVKDILQPDEVLTLQPKEFYAEKYGSQFKTPEEFDAQYAKVAESRKEFMEHRSNYGNMKRTSSEFLGIGAGTSRYGKSGNTISYSPIDLDYQGLLNARTGQFESLYTDEQLATRAGFYVDETDGQKKIVQSSGLSAWDRFTDDYVLKQDEFTGKFNYAKVDSNQELYKYKHASIFGDQERYGYNLISDSLGGLWDSVLSTGEAIPTIAKALNTTFGGANNGFDKVMNSMINSMERVSYRASEEVEKASMFDFGVGTAFNFAKGVGYLLPQRWGASIAAMSMKGMAKLGTSEISYLAKIGANAAKSSTQNAVIKGTAATLGAITPSAEIYAEGRKAGLDTQDAAHMALLATVPVFLSEKLLGVDWLTRGLTSPEQKVWTKTMTEAFGSLKSTGTLNAIKTEAGKAKFLKGMFETFQKGAMKLKSASGKLGAAGGENLGKMKNIITAARNEAMQEWTEEYSTSIMKIAHDVYTPLNENGEGHFGTTHADALEAAFGGAFMGGLVGGVMSAFIKGGSELDNERKDTMYNLLAEGARTNGSTGVMQAYGKLKEMIVNSYASGQFAGQYEAHTGTAIEELGEENAFDAKIELPGLKDNKVRSLADMNYYTAMMQLEEAMMLTKEAGFDDPSLVEALGGSSEFMVDTLNNVKAQKDQKNKIIAIQEQMKGLDLESPEYSALSKELGTQQSTLSSLKNDYDEMTKPEEGTKFSKRVNDKVKQIRVRTTASKKFADEYFKNKEDRDVDAEFRETDEYQKVYKTNLMALVDHYNTSKNFDAGFEAYIESKQKEVEAKVENRKNISAKFNDLLAKFDSVKTVEDIKADTKSNLLKQLDEILNEDIDFDPRSSANSLSSVTESVLGRISEIQDMLEENNQMESSEYSDNETFAQQLNEKVDLFNTRADNSTSTSDLKESTRIYLYKNPEVKGEVLSSTVLGSVERGEDVRTYTVRLDDGSIQELSEDEIDIDNSDTINREVEYKKYMFDNIKTDVENIQKALESGKGDFEQLNQVIQGIMQFIEVVEATIESKNILFNDKSMKQHITPGESLMDNETYSELQEKLTDYKTLSASLETEIQKLAGASSVFSMRAQQTHQENNRNILLQMIDNGFESLFGKELVEKIKAIEKITVAQRDGSDVTDEMQKKLFETDKVMNEIFEEIHANKETMLSKEAVQKMVKDFFLSSVDKRFYQKTEEKAGALPYVLEDFHNINYHSPKLDSLFYLSSINLIARLHGVSAQKFNEVRIKDLSTTKGFVSSYEQVMAEMQVTAFLSSGTEVLSWVREVEKTENLKSKTGSKITITEKDIESSMENFIENSLMIQGWYGTGKTHQVLPNAIKYHQMITGKKLNVGIAGITSEINDAIASDLQNSDETKDTPITKIDAMGLLKSETLPQGLDLVVWDEASFLTKNNIAKIREKFKGTNTKLILLGDDSQMIPVDSAESVRWASEVGIKTTPLTNPYRNNSALIQGLAKWMIHGKSQNVRDDILAVEDRIPQYWWETNASGERVGTHYIKQEGGKYNKGIVNEFLSRPKNVKSKVLIFVDQQQYQAALVDYPVLSSDDYKGLIKVLDWDINSTGVGCVQGLGFKEVYCAVDFGNWRNNSTRIVKQNLAWPAGYTAVSRSRQYVAIPGPEQVKYTSRPASFNIQNTTNEEIDKQKEISRTRRVQEELDYLKAIQGEVTPVPVKVSQEELQKKAIFPESFSNLKAGDVVQMEFRGTKQWKGFVEVESVERKSDNRLTVKVSSQANPFDITESGVVYDTAPGLDVNMITGNESKIEISNDEETVEKTDTVDEDGIDENRPDGLVINGVWISFDEMQEEEVEQLNSAIEIEEQVGNYTLFKSSHDQMGNGAIPIFGTTFSAIMTDGLTDDMVAEKQTIIETVMSLPYIKPSLVYHKGIQLYKAKTKGDVLVYTIDSLDNTSLVAEAKKRMEKTQGTAYAAWKSIVDNNGLPAHFRNAMVLADVEKGYVLNGEKQVVENYNRPIEEIHNEITDGFSKATNVRKEITDDIIKLNKALATIRKQMFDLVKDGESKVVSDNIGMASNRKEGVVKYENKVGETPLKTFVSKIKSAPNKGNLQFANNLVIHNTTDGRSRAVLFFAYGRQPVKSDPYVVFETERMNKVLAADNEVKTKLIAELAKLQSKEWLSTYDNVQLFNSAKNDLLIIQMLYQNLSLIQKAPLSGLLKNYFKFDSQRDGIPYPEINKDSIIGALVREKYGDDNIKGIRLETEILRIFAKNMTDAMLGKKPNMSEYKGLKSYDEATKHLSTMVSNVRKGLNSLHYPVAAATRSDNGLGYELEDSVHFMTAANDIHLPYAFVDIADVKIDSVVKVKPAAPQGRRKLGGKADLTLEHSKGVLASFLDKKVTEQKATEIIESILGKDFIANNLEFKSDLKVGLREVYGLMKNGNILLNSKNGNIEGSTPRHEAFHVIWNYMLADETKTKVEAEIRKVLKRPTMSSHAIEEHIARKFGNKGRDGMASKYSFKGLLQRFFNFLEDMYNRMVVNTPELDSLFDLIESGHFKNMPLSMNNEIDIVKYNDPNEIFEEDSQLEKESKGYVHLLTAFGNQTGFVRREIAEWFNENSALNRDLSASVLTTGESYNAIYGQIKSYADEIGDKRIFLKKNGQDIISKKFSEINRDDIRNYDFDENDFEDYKYFRLADNDIFNALVKNIYPDFDTTNLRIRKHDNAVVYDKSKYNASNSVGNIFKLQLQIMPLRGLNKQKKLSGDQGRKVSTVEALKVFAVARDIANAEFYSDTTKDYESLFIAALTKIQNESGHDSYRGMHATSILASFFTNTINDNGKIEKSLKGIYNELVEDKANIETNRERIIAIESFLNHVLNVNKSLYRKSTAHVEIDRGEYSYVTSDNNEIARVKDSIISKMNQRLLDGNLYTSNKVHQLDPKHQDNLFTVSKDGVYWSKGGNKGATPIKLISISKNGVEFTQAFIDNRHNFLNNIQKFFGFDDVKKKVFISLVDGYEGVNNLVLESEYTKALKFSTNNQAKEIVARGFMSMFVNAQVGIDMQNSIKKLRSEKGLLAEELELAESKIKKGLESRNALTDVMDSLDRGFNISAATRNKLGVSKDMDNDMAKINDIALPSPIDNYPFINLISEVELYHRGASEMDFFYRPDGTKEYLHQLHNTISLNWHYGSKHLVKGENSLYAIENGTMDIRTLRDFSGIKATKGTVEPVKSDLISMSLTAFSSSLKKAAAQRSGARYYNLMLNNVADKGKLFVAEVTFNKFGQQNLVDVELDEDGNYKNVAINYDNVLTALTNKFNQLRRSQLESRQNIEAFLQEIRKDKAFGAQAFASLFDKKITKAWQLNDYDSVGRINDLFNASFEQLTAEQKTAFITKIQASNLYANRDFQILDGKVYLGKAINVNTSDTNETVYTLRNMYNILNKGFKDMSSMQIVDRIFEENANANEFTKYRNELHASGYQVSDDIKALLAGTSVIMTDSQIQENAIEGNDQGGQFGLNDIEQSHYAFQEIADEAEGIVRKGEKVNKKISAPIYDKTSGTMNPFFKAHFLLNEIFQNEMTPFINGLDSDYVDSTDRSKRTGPLTTGATYMNVGSRYGLAESCEVAIIKDHTIKSMFSDKQIKVADGLMVGFPVFKAFQMVSIGGIDNAQIDNGMQKTLTAQQDENMAMMMIKHANINITTDIYKTNPLYRVMLDSMLDTVTKSAKDKIENRISTEGMDAKTLAKHKRETEYMSDFDLKTKFHEFRKKTKSIEKASEMLRNWIVEESFATEQIKQSLIWGFQYESGSKTANTKVNTFDFVNDDNVGSDIKTRKVDTSKIGLVLNPYQDVERAKNVAPMNQILAFIGIGNSENERSAMQIYEAFSKIYDLENDQIKSDIEKDFDNYVRQKGILSAMQSGQPGILAEALSDPSISIQMPQFRTKLVQVFRNFLTERTIRQRMYGIRVNQTSGHGYGLFEENGRKFTLAELESILDTEVDSLEVARLIEVGGKYKGYNVTGLRNMEVVDGKVQKAEVGVSFSYFKNFGLKEGTSLNDVFTINYDDGKKYVLLNGESREYYINEISKEFNGLNIMNTIAAQPYLKSIGFDKEKFVISDFVNAMADYYMAFNKTLDMYVARVPSSRLGSGAIVRPAFFIQDSANVIAIPLGLTELNDSDFDIDQLSLYQYSVSKKGEVTNVDENSDVSKFTSYEEINDLVLNNIIKMYSDVNNVKNIHIESNLSKLRKAAEGISEMDPKELKDLSPKEITDLEDGEKVYSFKRMNSYSTFLSDYSINASGNDAIAIIARSLSSVSYISQLSPTLLAKYAPGFNNFIDVNKLQGTESTVVRIGDYLQAALDNAKELILGRMGITVQGSALIAPMILNGWSNAKIKAFFSNRAVRKALEKMEQGNKVTNKRADYRPLDIIDEALSKIKDINPADLFDLEEEYKLLNKGSEREEEVSALLNAAHNRAKLAELKNLYNQGEAIRRFGDVLNTRNGLKVHDFEFEKTIQGFERSFGMSLANYVESEEDSWNIETHLAHFMATDDDYRAAVRFDKVAGDNKKAMILLDREKAIASMLNIAEITRLFPHFSSYIKLYEEERVRTEEKWTLSSTAIKELGSEYLETLGRYSWDFKTRRAAYYNVVSKALVSFHLTNHADFKNMKVNINNPIEERNGLYAMKGGALNAIQLNTAEGRMLFKKQFPEYISFFKKMIDEHGVKAKAIFEEQGMSLFAENFESMVSIDKNNNVKINQFIDRVDVYPDYNQNTLILRDSISLNEHQLEVLKNSFSLLPNELQKLFAVNDFINYAFQNRNGTISDVIGLSFYRSFSDSVKEFGKMMESNDSRQFKANLVRHTQFSKNGTPFYNQDVHEVAGEARPDMVVKRVKVRQGVYMAQHLVYNPITDSYNPEDVEFMVNYEIEANPTLVNDPNFRVTTSANVIKVFNAEQLADLKDGIPVEVPFYKNAYYHVGEEYIAEDNSTVKVTRVSSDYTKVAFAKSNSRINEVETITKEVRKLELAKANVSLFSLDERNAEYKYNEGKRLDSSSVNIVASHLEKTVGVKFITETDESIKRKFGNVTARAFVDKDGIHYNIDRVLSTDMMHEVSHLWYKGIEKHDKQLWNDLQIEAMEMIKNNHPIAYAVKNKILSNGLELNHDEYIEEVIANIAGLSSEKALADFLKENKAHSATKKGILSSIWGSIKDLARSIGNVFNKIFGLTSDAPDVLKDIRMADIFIKLSQEVYSGKISKETALILQSGFNHFNTPVNNIAASEMIAARTADGLVPTELEAKEVIQSIQNQTQSSLSYSPVYNDNGDLVYKININTGNRFSLAKGNLLIDTDTVDFIPLLNNNSTPQQTLIEIENDRLANAIVSTIIENGTTGIFKNNPQYVYEIGNDKRYYPKTMTFEALKQSIVSDIIPMFNTFEDNLKPNIVAFGEALRDDSVSIYEHGFNVFKGRHYNNQVMDQLVNVLGLKGGYVAMYRYSEMMEQEPNMRIKELYSKEFTGMDPIVVIHSIDDNGVMDISLIDATSRPILRNARDTSQKGLQATKESDFDYYYNGGRYENHDRDIRKLLLGMTALSMAKRSRQGNKTKSNIKIRNIGVIQIKNNGLEQHMISDMKDVIHEVELLKNNPRFKKHIVNEEILSVFEDKTLFREDIQQSYMARLKTYMQYTLDNETMTSEKKHVLTTQLGILQSKDSSKYQIKNVLNARRKYIEGKISQKELYDHQEYQWIAETLKELDMNKGYIGRINEIKSMKEYETLLSTAHDLADDNLQWFVDVVAKTKNTIVEQMTKEQDAMRKSFSEMIARFEAKTPAAKLEKYGKDIGSQYFKSLFKTMDINGKTVTIPELHWDKNDVETKRLLDNGTISLPDLEFSNKLLDSLESRWIKNSLHRVKKTEAGSSVSGESLSTYEIVERAFKSNINYKRGQVPMIGKNVNELLFSGQKRDALKRFGNVLSDFEMLFEGDEFGTSMNDVSAALDNQSNIKDRYEKAGINYLGVDINNKPILEIVDETRNKNVSTNLENIFNYFMLSGIRQEQYEDKVIPTYNSVKAIISMYKSTLPTTEKDSFMKYNLLWADEYLNRVVHRRTGEQAYSLSLIQSKFGRKYDENGNYIEPKINIPSKVDVVKTGRALVSATSFVTLGYSTGVAFKSLLFNEISMFINSASATLSGASQGNAALPGIKHVHEATIIALNGKGSKEFKKAKRLALDMQLILRTEKDLLDNPFINQTSKSIFQSTYAHIMNWGTDSAARMIAMIAIMKKDGSWDAYEYDEQSGNVVYNEKKDSRFYTADGKEKTENGEDKIKEMIRQNLIEQGSQLESTKELVRGYDFALIDGTMKWYADKYIIGTMDELTKPIIGQRFVGASLSNFKMFSFSRMFNLGIFGETRQTTRGAGYKAIKDEDGQWIAVRDLIEIEGAWQSFGKAFAAFKGMEGQDLKEFWSKASPVTKMNITKTFIQVGMFALIAGLVHGAFDDEKFTWAYTDIFIAPTVSDFVSGTPFPAYNIISDFLGAAVGGDVDKMAKTFGITRNLIKGEQNLKDLGIINK